MKKLVVSLLSVFMLAACTPAVSGGGGGGGCCRVCTSGKPCGDSCIARDKTCNKGPGCACSGATPGIGGELALPTCSQTLAYF